MHIPSISPPMQAIEPALQHLWNNKTKPLGSLGRLETLGIQLGLIQQTEQPALHKPHVLVFAADHGLAAAGVSAYPQAVTRQMVYNFLAGGAAISVLAQQHHLALRVVDCGVIGGPFEPHPALWAYRLGDGSANSLNAPALTTAQLDAAFAAGAAIVTALQQAGCNTLLVGEMGIGNTSAASLLLHRLTGLPLVQCVGPGTGLDSEGVARKLAILQQVADTHASATTPLDALQALGGLELAVMAATMLHAAAAHMVILLDGFITSAALLVAAQLQPAITDYVVACHCSAEPAHRHLLDVLNLHPLLDLNLRLGEGSGAALAYPLVASAVHLMRDMASFERAGVSNKS